MTATVTNPLNVDSQHARRRRTVPAVFQNWLFRVGAAIVILLSLLAVAAPALTRWNVLHEPIQQDQKGLDEDGMPLPPGDGYLLGTDNLGRDVLSRVTHGTRVSLTIGIAAMLTAVFLGVSGGNSSYNAITGGGDSMKAVAREYLGLCEKKMPDQWETFEARSLLGGSLLGQKKNAQAEPLLLSGYEGLKQREAKIPVESRARLKEALQRLVQLYEATGRTDQARAWKQKLAEFEKAQAGTKPAAARPTTSPAKR